MNRRVGVFDLDGTLIDSDAALTAPFVALGVPAEKVTFGHVLADECHRLGIALDDYLDAYDPTAAQPFPGVSDLVARLDRWAVCSNKRDSSGRAELARLGWQPDLALFADAFDGPKQLAPVLASLHLDASDILFVGDTPHDRACAAAIGCDFVLAGWNPRTVAEVGDIVAGTPAVVAELLA